MKRQDEPNGSQGAQGPKTPKRLRKRFYKVVAVAEVDCIKSAQNPPGSAISPPPIPPRKGEGTPRGQGRARAFRVLLDGKPVKTPAAVVLELPSRALAQAIAGEWEAQAPDIDPETMPLTKLANSAVDGVRPREAAVRAEIVKYALSDLLCYRASGPRALMLRQAELWDPIVAWAREALGARFELAEGIMPVAQPKETQAAMLCALERFDVFGLASLHVMTTLTGSALLAMAHVHGRLSAPAAWKAAHVDEDWQSEQWGIDAEAQARRARRWSEMDAASRLFALSAQCAEER
jgi:chaperone required for assembly of F1-ATPase